MAPRNKLAAAVAAPDTVKVKQEIHKNFGFLCF
jgi:hypothetical protein